MVININKLLISYDSSETKHETPMTVIVKFQLLETQDAANSAVSFGITKPWHQHGLRHCDGCIAAPWVG